MDGRYRVIDEVSLSILGVFDSRGDAVDFVAALLTVNDDDFLDELTIANDAGPLFYGDSLRDALREGEASRERAASGRSNAGNGGDEGSVEALVAKGYPY